MPKRNARASGELAAKAMELAIATPQVVAHRLTRLALAGPNLSAQDTHEFQRMINEKHSAFFESWSAMATHSILANQALAQSLFRSLLPSADGALFSPADFAVQLQKSVLEVADKGLTPVHKKAVANAKRLARVKQR